MSANAFSATLYTKECSIASARSKSACTPASQEVANLTVPSLPTSLPGASSSCASAAAGAARKAQAQRRGRRRILMVSVLLVDRLLYPVRRQASRQWREGSQAAQNTGKRDTS